ncbi:hypothetical protein ABMC89_09930 [Sulfitobacter sp. HNIBRBA3233]|uniref:phosphatase domain-containing putative toxin n=1 Tax=Sulfitobacter marinivivus TaxID=3158558 RepID=UPI0032DF6888
MARPAQDNPRADLDRIRAAGIDTVVSLLERHEAAALGLQDEALLCDRAGLRFLNHPIPDMALPEAASFNRLVDDLAARLRAGESVAVHCRASIGRTGMVCAGVLGRFGRGAEDAIATVSAARGVTVPDTAEQAAFIHAMIPTT